ncbi:MAG: DUF6470 family protein [Syntrophomonadaceae bacterium]
MQLRITSQMARIGLDISKPTLNLQSTKPQVELDITPARLDITSPRPKVMIDQSQCFADEGLQSLLDFALYCSGYSRSEFSDAIDKRVSDGNNLAAIHTGSSIADLGREAMQEKQHVFEIRAMPQQPPIIEADIQPVSINYEPAKVNSSLNRGIVDPQFQWGKVGTYVAQRNYIDIQWIDEHI